MVIMFVDCIILLIRSKGLAETGVASHPKVLLND